MKVALIRPPLLQPLKGLSIVGGVPPLGLAYVAAATRQAGHTVQVVDGMGSALERTRRFDSPIEPFLLSGLDVDQIVERVDHDVEAIGISHLFLHEWPLVRRLATLLRTRFPRAPVVLGGDNAAAFAPWILRESPAVDCCVIGEGDETFPQLLRCLASGQALDRIPGLALRRVDGSLHTTAPAHRLLDIDALPRPAWDLFPMENYLRMGNQYGVERGRSLPVLASRGCPYHCTFCSAAFMWGARYVTRDPQRLADEMAEDAVRWSVRDFDFVDMTAFVSRTWLERFCSALQAHGLGLTWQLPSGTRSEVFEPDLLAIMARAGCRNITLAPESGSSRILQAVQKQVDVPRLLSTASAAARQGIVVRINVIIGFPMEGWRDLACSLGLLVRAALAGVHDAAVIVFSPYPGSAMFDQLLKAGRLQVDERYPYVALARGGAYCDIMTSWQLKVCQKGFLALFYACSLLLAPRRIARTLTNLWRGREETQLEQFVRIKWSRLVRGLRGRLGLRGESASQVGVGKA